MAIEEKNWAEVVCRAKITMKRFPRHVYCHMAVARGYREAGDYEEAEKTLTATMRRFRGERHALREYAMVAHSRAMASHFHHDWLEASRRWKKVRTRFAPEAAVFVLETTALWELNLFNEADAVLERGLACFPSDADILRSFAETAHRRKEWNEAALRWERFRNVYDSRPDGYVHGSAALRSADRLHEAALVMKTALFLFPNNAAVRQESDKIAEVTGIPL